MGDLKEDSGAEGAGGAPLLTDAHLLSRVLRGKMAQGMHDSFQLGTAW